MKLSLFATLAALASSVVDASTLTPPVLPLFVRSPYLSFWLPRARHEPWHEWPQFWTGSTVGFAVMARVPETGTVYPLLGRPHDFLTKSSNYGVDFAEYHGATYDASTTNLTYSLGGSDVRVTLSFLSPITPTSTFRQSLPASYLNVFVEGSLDVSIFIDINGEFVSGHRDSQITWDFKQSNGSKHADAIKTWSFKRATEQILTESWDKAEWGTFHFSGPVDTDHQSGEIRTICREFAETSALKNFNDEVHRGIFEKEPVFAFAKTFKLSKKAGNGTAYDQALFTFALVQDPVIHFASARGLTMMRPLWASYFSSAEEMLQYHYNDYETAVYLSDNYSDQLAKDAYASGSQDYQDIVALSARQVLGGTQFAGTPEDPILFLKEISSDGNLQTVDVIFPAFPFFLYTNPQWLAYLLEPLIEHQLSGQYPNDYSMHDLGAHYPNATGHNDGADEYMPVEECGNMLIMGLALVNGLKDETAASFTREALPSTNALDVEPSIRAQMVDKYGIDLTYTEQSTTGKSAAQKWVSRSYKLWKKWTGYLVRESLIPANQLCTDDFAGWLANNTNLALKGIVGIKAMAGLSELVGEDKDAKYYNDVAADYIEKWQEYGLSRDGTHAKLAYTWYGSWTTLYNIFADALLCFHLPKEKSSVDPSWLWTEDEILLGTNKKSSQTFIPDSIYKMQSNWYHAVLQRYGLPLDSRHMYTKSDWEFFAAAVASKKVRSEILTHVATWVNETSTGMS